MDTDQIKVRALNDAELDNIAKVRALISYWVPWIVGALYGYRIVATTGVGRHLVDEHGRIYLASEHLTGLTARELSGEVLGLLWKLLRKHPQRQISNGALVDVWDIASELSVNRTVESPLTKPKLNKTYTFELDPNLIHYTDPTQFGLTRDDQIELTAEQIYSKLMKFFREQERQQGNGQPGQGQDGEGDPSGQGSGQGQPGDTGDPADSQGGPGSGQGQSIPGDGFGDEFGQGQGQGSGSASGADDASESDQNAEEQGTPAPGSGMANRTLTELADRIADRMAPEHQDGIQSQVASEARNNKSRGNALPEGAEEWAAEILMPPVISPRDLMLNTVGHTFDKSRTGNHSTYARRSRRQQMGDKVLYKGKAQIITPVFIGIDVSGSMSDGELTRAFSEVANVAATRGLEVNYFSVSTMPHGLRKLERGSRPVFDRDRAGTDMRIAFEMFSVHKARSAVLMTDGETDWPTEFDPIMRKCLVAVTAYSKEQYERMSERIPSFLDRVWLPVGDDH